MIIKKVLCDRCGAEIEGEHPPRFIKQTFVVSEKPYVANAYRNGDKIHFCEECSKSFEEFMNYER